MGPARAQAQAQGQKTHVISKNESLQLSVFHVSYLRGLFPESSFKGVDMKNLDDMHIKMLVPTCEESRRLIDWVEHGVYDAVKQGYLKALFFGISLDPEGTDLLEEYIFHFSYGEGGEVSFNVTAKGKKGKKGTESIKPQADISSVRWQVTRLMRMLVQVCQTLDKVPDERYLFCKLVYHDHTPEDYEPPYFVKADETSVGHFAKRPFSMYIGGLATGHHNVGLRVKSVLDCLDEDAGTAPGEVEALQASAQLSDSIETEAVDDVEVESIMDAGQLPPVAEEDGNLELDGAAMEVHGGIAGHTHGASKAADQVEGRDVPPRKRAKADLAALMTEDQPDDVSMEEDMPTGCLIAAEHSQQYAKVKAFCSKRSEVEVADVMAQFFDVSSSLLDMFFVEMQKEGLLQPTTYRDVYKVMPMPGTQQVLAGTVDRVAQHDMVTQQLGGLTVGEAMRQKAMENASAASQQATNKHVGSEFSGNPVPALPGRTPGHKAPAPYMEGTQPDMVYFDQSQQSDRRMSNRSRKASFVEQPIHQSSKPQREKKRPPTPTPGMHTRSTRSRVQSKGK